MDDQQATKELSWLAGFIEADGSLQVMVQLKNNNQIKLTPLVTGVGCELDLIDRCADIIKSHCDVNPHRGSFKQGGNKRIAHRFTVSKQAGCVKVLEKLMPLMWGRKREIANLILEFCHSRFSIKRTGWQGGKPYTQRELEIAQRITQLNSVGASETTRKSVMRLRQTIEQMI